MAVVVYVPSRLGEGFFTDLPAPTAGDDAKAITYDHSTQVFVYAAASAVPGGSTAQVQYNNAGAFAGDAGMTYDAANDRLTVAGGLVVPSMRPELDGPTALQLQNAAGTAVVTVDTTNNALLLPGMTNLAQAFSGFEIAAPDGTKLVSFQGIKDNGGKTTSFYSNNRRYSDGNWSAVGHDATRPGITHFMIDNIWSLWTFAANSIDPVFVLNVSTTGLRIDPVGALVYPPPNSTAHLELAGSTTARASLRIRSGTAPTAPNDGDMWNDGNAYTVMVNGTNAVNTDGGLSVWMQSSLQARNVGRLLWQYTDKTDATRVTKGALTAYYQSTERKAIHWSADASGPLLSFGAVTTPIATPVLATGASATPDDIIQVLQNLGLVKQS
jgi:hypothetical protein